MKCDFCTNRATIYIYIPPFYGVTFPQNAILTCEEHEKEAHKRSVEYENDIVGCVEGIGGINFYVKGPETYPPGGNICERQISKQV